MECAYCDYEKHTKAEEFAVLEVTPPRQRKPVTLLELLQGKLQEFNDFDYKCDKCGQRNGSYQNYVIQKLAEYLILDTQRFEKNQGRPSDSLTKVRTPITFPDGTIDLSALLPEDQQQDGAQYELFSMIIHKGYGWFACPKLN